jgi:hypothetical protein
MAKTIEELQKNLFSEKDGSKFSKTKDKLIKQFSENNRDQVVDMLMEYSRHGSLLHWRNFLLTDIIRLVHDQEISYAAFFEWALSQPELMYWSIDGILKTKGADAYEALVALAVNDQLRMDVRAKAIKSIAVRSKQPFDRDLPLMIRS